MNLLVQLIISTLAVIITSFILPGVVIDSGLTGIFVAAVLSLFNTLVRPVLVLLTIPITFLTLGLFLLIINAGIIMLVSYIVPGFSVDGFWTAFFFSIILTIITGIFNSINKRSK